MKHILRAATAALILLTAASSLFGADGWTVEVRGARNDVLDSVRFEEMKGHGSHYVTLELERKGTVSTYRAMPFRLAAAMADGDDAVHPYRFDEALWNAGYEVTLIAADGYAATFVTSEVPFDDLFIADEMDGEPVPPMIVGNVPGNLWVRDLAAIELGLGSLPEEPEFVLTFEAGEMEEGFTIAELEKTPYYVEGTGSYTTSAGTKYTHTYGGVRFTALLGRYVGLSPDTQITVVASDGYEMSYSGEQLLDAGDGEWILAFKQDGEYLPPDPGYVRTVKIGPGNPNIDGHLSARMVERVVVSGTAFRPFELVIDGKRRSVLDRQTVQSGVSCHERTVAHKDKKTGAVTAYTGIPVWRLIAYADDPILVPHGQDKSIISYDSAAAEAGYGVTIEAADGFSRTLDSRELHMNDDVILALYREGEELPDREAPLILVWDQDAETVPENITSIRGVVKITLVFGDR